MTGFKDKFKSITGNEPYSFQIETYSALTKGKSIILRAPTGSGKSEAVYIPFLLLKGKDIPPRLIYTLPMRSLVNSLHERFKSYTPNLDVRAQHGKRPESLLFDADCVVATLDQVISSYACAPLTLGVRFGNIPAGGVAGSFLVFDEIHTFDPELGLQSCLILAERMRNLKVPFVIMTATLPSEFMDYLANELNSEIIDVAEDEIPARTKRKVTVEFHDRLMSPDEVLSLINGFQGRIIIACNTVKKSRDMYRDLKGKTGSEFVLIHSRFFDDDRSRIENKISRLFGKNSQDQDNAIIITTQVIEAGMDISCDLLLSELSPVDSLIQRAGRCARWGGEGRFIIFDTSDSAPYDKHLVDLTRDVLIEFRNENLSWAHEKHLVDKVLTCKFKEAASFKARAKPMMYLSEAAFKGRSYIAEKAVRDTFFVEVSIHDNPCTLGEKITFLPKCKIQTQSFKYFVKENKPPAWLIELDFKPDQDYDDYRPNIQAIPLKSEEDVQTNKFYVIHSSNASYNPEEGLVLGVKGNSLEISVEEKLSSGEGKKNIPLETWREHSLRVRKIFEDKIYPAEKYIYLKISDFLGESEEKIIEILRFVLLVHDLGKLNESWQKAIGNNKEFLAHSGNAVGKKLPPHATVSAYILDDYLREEWGFNLGRAAFFSIAHHHSVRAMMVPKYKMSMGWDDEVNSVLRDNGLKILPSDIIKKYEYQETCTQIRTMPAFEKEKIYTTYLIFSRALRLSDRLAISGLTSDTVSKRMPS